MRIRDGARRAVVEVLRNLGFLPPAPGRPRQPSLRLVTPPPEGDDDKIE